MSPPPPMADQWPSTPLSPPPSAGQWLSAPLPPAASLSPLAGPASPPLLWHVKAWGARATYVSGGERK